MKTRWYGQGDIPAAAGAGIARRRAADYTRGVADPSPADRPSLRAEQVAQTHAALIAAGRLLFGRDGYAATSVEDVAREARVTTGALYHHFATKGMLFEAVFEAAHGEMLEASQRAAAGAPGPLEVLARAFEAFLDAVLQPDLQQILVVDGPAVLGPVRFTELDERYAASAVAAGLRAAASRGDLHVEDPETVARLLLGALTRGGMLIAGSAEPEQTRDAVARSMRALFAGLAAPAP
jgi:AcrR family transcriptional regulator